MNAKTKNSQMEHCSYPKYGMIYRLEENLYNLQVRRKHLKNDQLLQNMPLLNNLQYQHFPKI